MPNKKTTKKSKITKRVQYKYLQNRELSWLKFNERVLDQANNQDNPDFEKLNFVSIFSSNLYEFMSVRVGTLTDLTHVKNPVIDNKSGMTPQDQIAAIFEECSHLLPKQKRIFEKTMNNLQDCGLKYLRIKDMSAGQIKYIRKYSQQYILPYLSPQIVNATHPFPHLKSQKLYVIGKLSEEKLTGDKASKGKLSNDKKSSINLSGDMQKSNKSDKKQALAIVPLPEGCERIIPFVDENSTRRFKFTLIEQAIMLMIDEIFKGHNVTNVNVVTVIRNADLDMVEGSDEVGNDFREHMKRIVKKRTRLAPLCLFSEKQLNKNMQNLLLPRLNIESNQAFSTTVPLDMSFICKLKKLAGSHIMQKITYPQFEPAWPANISKKRSMLDQISRQDLCLHYPYDSFEPMVKLIRDAADDPNVVSIKITLYRVAKESRIAEALMRAAENGKEVTALFELRARFDESNNIQWSHRLEESGANVIYGFHDYKVHSKVCVILRKKPLGKFERIVQFGTGNYNETTAKLYTDISYFTSNVELAQDAEEFYKNLSIENISDNYNKMWVAPLQIKQNIIKNINRQINLAKNGQPNGLFFKTNSVTNVDIIKAIVKASKAGVKTTILCRGICCIIPGIQGYTENVEVVSIVGQLLEHSRIYGFGPLQNMELYCSSADLMTRNMDRRIEVAWPVLNDKIRKDIISYIDKCLKDDAKLRVLKSNCKYTKAKGSNDSQQQLINQVQQLDKANKRKKGLFGLGKKDDKSNKKNRKTRKQIKEEKKALKNKKKNQQIIAKLEKKQAKKQKPKYKANNGKKEKSKTSKKSKKRPAKRIKPKKAKQTQKQHKKTVKNNK